MPTDADGVTIDPIVTMDGEHHFNETTFADVFVSDADVLGRDRRRLASGDRRTGLRAQRSGAHPVDRAAAARSAQALSRQAAEEGVDDRTAAAVGDLVARLISLRQLSVSVAHALVGRRRSAANQAALVKDLGTRFEQDSVDLAADLMDYVATRGQPAAVVGGCAAALADVHAARRDERGVARRDRSGNGVAMSACAKSGGHR